MKLPPIISIKRRLLFLRLIGNGFLQAMMTVLITLLIKSTFDNYLNTTATPVTSLWYTALGFLGATLVISWLKFRERVDSESVGQDYVHELRIKMFAKYCNGDLRKLEQQSKGAMSLRFATDLSALRQWISLGLSRLIVAGVNLVIALSVLCYINFVLGFSVSLIILVSALLSFGTGKKLRYTFVDARRKRSYLANNLNEKVSSLATVKVFGQRQREKNRVRRQSERLMAAMYERARAIGFLRAITEGGTVLASSMVLLIGAWLMSTNKTTPGTVVAALGVVNLLMQPLRHLGRIYEYRLNASVAEEKIKSFLDTRPSVLARHRKERRGHGELRLKEVSFFPNSEAVNLKIGPGTTIAILGVNGAGKSTILSQFAGLLTPSSGKFFLGQNDVCKLKDSALRKSIGMVSPNLPLLKGSIRNNICYRHPNATEEEIAFVVNRCGLEQLLNSLPEGLETKLTEAGQNLSQGERQRIALARAIIGTPELLVLDEADAFLDDEATALFSEIIRNHPGIAIMATHNIEHVVISDQIWLIDNGRLCWNGPREELPMNLYAELFEAKSAVGSSKAREGADV
ncbi:MAG: ABC transporter ATP-binding protein [Gammaproteobacteria bacterium]|nr:MAG: ABC transporter ATP-binding protein [Gammaproteobacteria bacterium]